MDNSVNVYFDLFEMGNLSYANGGHMQKNLPKNVLIIDNNNSDKPALQQEYQLFNCIVISDFQNALNLICTNFTPKVIVCNIDLEDNPLTGLSFISTIKTNQTWSRIPIIVLSKHRHSEIILESLKAGAIDFVPCPYEPVELFNRIQHASMINQSPKCQHDLQITQKKKFSTELRKLYVKTMNNAVLYWETCTQSTKIDLAESSGLWSVYLEKNGVFRTRTLDRYLDEKSLPKNPKVKLILLTANYVLNHCNKQCIIQQKLKQCFDQLMEIEKMTDLYTNN